VTVDETTGVVSQPDVSSEIVPGSSGLLSNNDVEIDPCDACVNGETCVDSVCVTLCGGAGGQVCTSGQVCSTTSNTCIDLCGTTECTSAQQCVNSVCEDLCGGAGGQLCTGGQVCTNGSCVTPDPCMVGTPAVGTTCSDGTKYVSATLRTTASNE
jgi:hypothetical protein